MLDLRRPDLRGDENEGPQPVRIIQGMCRVPGFEKVLDRPDLTAAAGPVLAVRRQRFLEVGGYDPIFFPGRIEDLDLGFRGWMAGYRGYYVPESVAYHQGFGTFGPQLGAGQCDQLASRNSLIFAWKNTSGMRLVSHFFWLPIRLGHAFLNGRVGFIQGLISALAQFIASWLRGGRFWSGRGDGSKGRRRFIDGFTGNASAAYQPGRPRNGGTAARSGIARAGAGQDSLRCVDEISENAGRRLMSSRAVHVVIDARPRGPRGLLAAEVVMGRSMLCHLIDLAARSRLQRADYHPRK